MVSGGQFWRPRLPKVDVWLRGVAGMMWQRWRCEDKLLLMGMMRMIMRAINVYHHNESIARHHRPFPPCSNDCQFTGTKPPSTLASRSPTSTTLRQKHRCDSVLCSTLIANGQNYRSSFIKLQTVP